ncbi:FMN-binding negative transcriptional regulator [Comamonas aquatica]|uniref:FMN-binding negative transcriptional regulator n=1 Tax=Comamonas aquatica TaxID=225991 RepID=UPI0028D78BA8|nr:FMN-binding negative transcriptional regulator [Comamonas aquatica]
MYLPAHFAANTADAYDLIRQHPLGALVHQHAGGLDANHLPWELETPEAAPARLIGHVARANPLLEQLHDGVDVLVIFQAEQAYISPNWYPSKHATHQQVPTWNYRVVHVHGRLQLHDDRKWVLGAVGKLTRTHEARTQGVVPHAAGAWKIKDAPPDYLERQLAHIVGIEIAITRVQAKFKLSQNRSAGDRHAAATSVAAAGHPALGAAMQGD